MRRRRGPGRSRRSPGRYTPQSQELLFDPSWRYGMVLGVCDDTPEAKADARRATARGLVGLMGAERDGPVHWYEFHREKALLLIDQQPVELYPRSAKRQMRRLVHDGGVLVVASARSNVPRPEARS